MENVQRGVLAEVDDKHYMVAPVSNATIDALAAFEAEREEQVNDLEDESGVDAEPDFDNEDDYCNGTPI